jgi:hypothetical protein
MKLFKFQLDIVASSQCKPFFNRFQITGDTVFLFRNEENQLPVTINTVTPQIIQNHTDHQKIRGKILRTCPIKVRKYEFFHCLLC